MNADVNLENPLVRDLAWALASPPLLRLADADVHWPDTDWFQAILSDYADALRELNNDPSPLRRMVDSQRDRRIGHYFETLWNFWLRDNPHYHLLFANLPVHGNSRTLGEFDFLVQDKKTGKTLHWEVAVKFYLGVADTQQPRNWLGPARRDRLDIKTHRLLSHQGKLARYAEAAQLFERLGIKVDETWLILKGRLFYPVGIQASQPRGACPRHSRGFWLTPDLLPLLPTSLWVPLARHQWLAPLTDVDPAVCLDGGTLAEKWQESVAQYPLCIARIVDGMEVERGFMVAADWDNASAPS